jgi:amino acid adenylation domain-containing protein/non-ribosomal peptide synthase protein (TIGR01720 family)
MNKEEIESIYPLSPMQEGMLFHSIDGQESKVYVVVLQFSLHGALNVPAFKRAWQQTIDRHPVLRTFFIWKNRDTPLQIVPRRIELPWQEYDWRHLTDSEQTELLKSYSQTDRMRGFNLSKAPLIRLTLVQTTENDNHFFFSHHHMLLDGWSVALLLKEVFAVYQANCRGKNITLEELESFKAYITWLKHQNLSEAELYWRKTLQGFTQPTPIYLDKALGNTQSSKEVYDEQNLRLSKTTTAGLQLLAQKHQITLSTLIQGGWALLLSRYSGETDVVFGTVVSGRSIALPGIESMIGLFINTLPVRVQISPQAPLMPWLKELQGQQVQARKFEHSSLRNIQAWSGLVRSQGQSLFDSILVFGNYPLNDFLKDVDGDLEVGNLSFLEGSNYPLTVLIDPSEELTIRVSYDTRRFNDTSGVQILEHLQTLLENFTVNPYQSLSTFSPLSAEEKHQVLVDFNQTKVSYPTDKTLIQLFEVQVAKTPDTVAVHYGQDYLTYAQLNRRANQLAHFLQKMGVGPETLVGVFMERSLEMVISLYGILKAGGAYVPLDPEYPAERVAFMLEDTQVPVLLTQERLVDKLSKAQDFISKSQNPELICLDSEWTNIGQERPVNPVNCVTTDNLAYVIFTSGSTGRPKGVMNEHGGIFNRLLWMQDAYSLTVEDRVLQKTPFSFDVSVWEFFWPLMFGARLVVAKPGGHKDTRYLVKLIAEQAITTIHFVPSMLQAFLQDESAETCRSLKRVICSGEALPYALQERFFARLEAELHNLYGPTEAAVDVTYWACQRNSDLSTVPIGRPVANTQIYLLDSQLQPVSIGEPGELHIGGVQVARGYLNRSGLTAEKFIPDPFNSDPDARLYKTGDLASSLPDGNILYLGRLDHQVKIRGNRIELGEIEATLNQHPSVREAVVVAHELDFGDKRLVAYATLREANSPTVSQWRHFLSQTLPDYMIPSAYVVLSQLPLTHNGKVDWKALPVPELDRSTLGSQFVAPRNATEERLANIWATVLKLENVGTYDNFFDLGGDSIISIQIVAKASRAGLRLTPRQLFEYQTVAELCAVIDTAESITAEQGLITGSVPLTPIQHWFFEQSMSDQNYWNQSVIIDVLDELDPKLLEQALLQLPIQHDALRLQFLPETSAASPKWKQSINHAVPTIDFEMIDISTLPPNEQQHIVDTTISRLEAGHNLGQGKLVKAAYFKLGISQPNRLFITIHHLAVDGISWSILLQDVETAYTQLVHGQSIALPAKTTSFKAWAKKLNEFAQTEALRRELDYWATASNEEISEIPIDALVEAANTEMSARTISVSLTSKETLSLLKDVPPVYNTKINDALLTALAQTITTWTNQNTIYINLEGHGREEIIKNVDLTRTSGWFTTMFPMKLTLLGSPSPSAALKSIKEQLRCIPNRGIGYGLLRYLCKDEAVMTRLATLPKPQILFNYLGQFDRSLSDSALFRFTQPLVGAHSPEALRYHLLEINMIVISGCLRVDWTFSQNFHHRQTIQQLANNYAETLRTLIAHVLSPDEAGGFTPSDFPLAKLDEDKLSKLANILNEQE